MPSATETKDVELGTLKKDPNSPSSTSSTQSTGQTKYKPNPEEKANPLSYLFYLWLNPLIYLGYHKTLEEQDMFEIRKDLAAEKISSQFQREWEIEKKQAKPSVFKAIWKIIGKQYTIAGLLMAVCTGITFVNPKLVQYYVTFTTESIKSTKISNFQAPEVKFGYIYAVFMFVCPFFYTIGLNMVMRLCYGAGITVRTILITALFQKSLRLSPKARGEMSTGQIVNMMSTDASKIDLLLQWFHFGWTSFLALIVAIALLISTIGPSALAGIGVMFCFLPIQGTIMKHLNKYRATSAKWTDERVKLMNEILQGVRVIKVYAWEEPFAKKLFSLRATEMKYILRGSYVRGLNSSFMQIGPVMMAVVAYLVLASVNGGELNAADVFSSLVLFNLLRQPLIMLPMILAFTVDAFVSLDRITKFLLAEELQTGPTLTDASDYAIKIDNGEFTWDIVNKENAPTVVVDKSKSAQNRNSMKGGNKPLLLENKKDSSKTNGETGSNGTLAIEEEGKNAPPPPSFLKDINLIIPKNKCTMIVGAVGSGKSSLLSGIIGEMKRVTGEVYISGTVGYVSQQAWIQNCTLRDNILFGLPFDQRRYEEAIRVSCLAPDLAVLPAGDQTEIGEKGINLSGGQKQRVSLARAMYFAPDIIMLDDPLSALDAHVGKAVFEEMILGALGNKTRVLVTHQLQYAPRCDMIVFMKDGKIAEIGSFNQLIKNKGEFASLMDTYVGSQSDSENEGEDNDDKQERKEGENDDNTKSTKKAATKEGKDKDTTKSAGKAGGLMTSEERARGGLSLKVYLYYGVALGGAVVVAGILALLAISQGAGLYTNYWLTSWTNNQFNRGTHFYMWVYAVLGFGQCIFLVAATMIVLRLGCAAAVRLHDQSFAAVLRAPMSFFDTTPLGRIINRFSKDQDTVDTLLMDSLRMFSAMMLATIGTLILIAYVEVWFLVGLAPLAYVYIKVQSVYRTSSREIKRLDAVTRSPLFAHFSETLTGLPTIRAYRQSGRFIQENFNRMNGNNRPYFIAQTSQRWLAQILETIGALIIFVVAIIGVVQRFSSNAAELGLILSYAMNITGMLSWMIRQSVEAENYMNSVERSKFYTDDLPREAPAKLPGDSDISKSSWPEKGQIELKNVAMRYREGLPLVLDHVNATIKAGEKIGIVGRTGAGKSSLMVSLFRLVELCDGKIEIDGVDIKSLGLATLRSKMAIIPQDPVLYSGTIRTNLDPFKEYTDAQLWRVLEKCFLKEAVAAMDGQLDAVVAENGENLSVGQRCQVCLGRAMLRNAKILVMDEATASVDLQTDAWIQQSLRKEFSCTIMTIAHRLNTIIDYDRVMVLNQGKIVEFDTPAQLLRNPDSIFTALVNETGPENAALLKKVANAREQGIVIDPITETAATQGDLLQPQTRGVGVSHSVHFHL